MLSSMHQSHYWGSKQLPHGSACPPVVQQCNGCSAANPLRPAIVKAHVQQAWHELIHDRRVASLCRHWQVRLTGRDISRIACMAKSSTGNAQTCMQGQPPVIQVQWDVGASAHPAGRVHGHQAEIRD